MDNLELKLSQVLEDTVQNQMPSASFNSVWNQYKKEHKRSKKTFMAIIGGLIILPLSGFAYAHLNWSGSQIDISNQNQGPYSLHADPYFEEKVITQPGTQKFNLSKSKEIGNFPIREPLHVDGWKKIISEGIKFPSYNYLQDSHHQEKFTGISETPLMYLDIYINNSGQRIAVTQQYDYALSESLKRSVNPSFNKWTDGSHFQIGKNSTLIKGFSDSLAVLTVGKWSDLKGFQKQAGYFKDLLILHHEKNNTITSIAIDEYGDVSTSELKMFANIYLHSSD